MKDFRKSLEIHNQIVEGYANKLIEANPNLSPEEKVAATIATMLHDSGKLSSSLLEHHEQGVNYAEKVMNELIEGAEEIEGVQMTEGTKNLVKNAVMRHMNHPFLVMKNKMNNGEPFPLPENDVDKIVFDADMMANIGFKNVGFRLINEQFMNEDLEAAKKQDISALQAKFENVLSGVRGLNDVVLSDEAKGMTPDLIGQVEKIYNNLIKNNTFQKIQEKFSIDNQFDLITINQNGGPAVIKKELNDAIKKAAMEEQIDSKTVENFKM